MDMLEAAQNAPGVDSMTAEEKRAHLTSKVALARLRQECDELGSRTLEKLLELSGQTISAQGCPLPKKDLYATLVALHDSDPILQEFWNETTSVPSWVDWQQIQSGQEFFYRYAVANMIGFAFQGFIGENTAALGPAEVLVRTGGLSAQNLLQRVMETFQWLLEVTESLPSIQPGGKGHVSTVRVRLLHASVRRQILHLARSRPSYFNTEEYGIPVNTYDSILTITFFCCNPLWIQLPQMGIHPTSNEMQGFVAMYRYLGFVLGVPDIYFSTVEQAKATMDAMLADKKRPSESSRKIAHAFIDRLSDREPFRVSDAFIEAGSRAMNPGKLCDDLGLGQPSIVYYMAFSGLVQTLRLLALVQSASRSLDGRMIKYFRKVLPAIIVESKAGLGGASKFDFKFRPKLQHNAGKYIGKQGSGIKFWARPVESILVLIFAAYILVGAGVCVCFLKVGWSLISSRYAYYR